jgi:hypothetical protein
MQRTLGSQIGPLSNSIAVLALAKVRHSKGESMKAVPRRAFIGAIVGSGTKAGIIFCLLALCACQVALAAEPKRVLMLYSFGRDFKPWKDYASTIRSELERQSPSPLDIQDQSLVSARSSNEDPEVPFIEYLRALYRKNPPDIIVGIGAPAAVFVQQHRQQIFPKAPMVFTAMEERRIDVAALTEYDSVVAMTHDFAAAIENILGVLPDTKNVMVVNGYAEGKSHHQHPDFASRELCPAISVGSRSGHSRRQIEESLRTVFHQQGGRHGHGAVHRAHHHRSAPWADMGKKSRSRGRVV